MSERVLFDKIVNTVLEGTDADVGAHRNTIWVACITIIADCLRTADPFTRERLLRSLEKEVRDSIERLSQLLDGHDAATKGDGGVQ
jgi:hypothetical protein